MTDLTELQSAQTVKIAGSAPDGTESTFIKATANGELSASDISDNGGLEGAITIGTAASELKVGASTLSNRKAVTFSHVSGNGKIYWGHTAGVTTSTGTPIVKNTLLEWPCGPNTKVYLISDTAAQGGRVTERA